MNGFKITSPTTLPDLSELANQRMHWFRGDSEDRFQELVAMGELPPYGKTDVEYRFNSHGFRCPEFDSHSPKYAFYGCSIMQGYGLPEFVTIPAYVSRAKDKMAFNLGIAGASNDLIARTILSTVPLLNPEFVFVYWTYMTRRELYQEDGEPIQWLRNWRYQSVPVDRENEPMMEAQEEISHFTSNINNLLWNMKMVDLFLKGCNIKYAWSVVDGHLWRYEEVYKHFSVYSDNHLQASLADIGVDSARDMRHPGPKTTEKIAKGIVNYFLTD